MSEKNILEQPEDAARGSSPARCSASWTESVWNGTGYTDTRQIVKHAETVEEASLLLEKEMASPMMPNDKLTP